MKFKVKPNLNFWQIWNMSFGFLGIQYGFGLQQSNMSPIYRYLGADEASIPGLWLAGPLTGLLLQPVIGAMSDKSWSPRWGRRKPYIFFGAIAGSIAMVMMPNSKSVFMAACLMWLLDAGLNSSMEPFRAFIGDMLNNKQRPTGFALQSFMIGFGQTLSNLMPFILPLLGISLVATTNVTNGIPLSVRYPFYIGAAAILITVLITMLTTKEYPPEDESLVHEPEVYNEKQKKDIGMWQVGISISTGLMASLFAHRMAGMQAAILWGVGMAAGIYIVLFAPIFKSILNSLSEMPKVMRQLWWVKLFIWYGLPLMWQYLSLAVAKYAFNAPNPTVNPTGFEQGKNWGNLCFALFSITCFTISIFLPAIVRLINSRRKTLAFFLILGAIGFFIMTLTPSKWIYLTGMGLMGLAWGSIVSIPYLMVASAVTTERMGVYMGLLNGFICVPQFIGMLTVPLFYKSVLGDDPLHALVLCGICFVIAAALCFNIDENRDHFVAETAA
ncbi:MAG: MFS transporter [Saprospiraceae bacterium]